MGNLNIYRYSKLENLLEVLGPDFNSGSHTLPSSEE